jgi:hypothetical protein
VSLDSCDNLKVNRFPGYHLSNPLHAFNWALSSDIILKPKRKRKREDSFEWRASFLIPWPNVNIVNYSHDHRSSRFMMKSVAETALFLVWIMFALFVFFFACGTTHHDNSTSILLYGCMELKYILGAIVGVTGVFYPSFSAFL